MEALERAKHLHKQRHGLDGGKEILVPPSDKRMPTSLHEGASIDVAEDAMPLPPLVQLQVDPASCETNHILLTDEQMSQNSRGGAAYRMLRGRVTHRARGGNWTCLGITSPGPGEGKTVTCINLAVAVARDKQRPVYLIDLDMRNPSVLNYLGIRPPIPLSRYFTEPLTSSDVIYETDIEGLCVAGAVEPIREASELLASTRLDELLAAVRQRSPEALFLLDLPPVLSTDEALVVAPRTDAMFIVVAEGGTRRDGLSKSIDLLNDFNVAGIIMNRSGDAVGKDYYGY
jgi:Mrp family chromosome partitioning ATPase